jgi:hypothetical protein
MGNTDSTAAMGTGAGELTPQLRTGLVFLLRTQQCARELHRSAWDFAVEIASMSQLGFTTTDLRWLICKGYLAHAREQVSPHNNERVFSPSDGLSFCEKTCFVLTVAGEAFARSICPPRTPAEAGNPEGMAEARSPAVSAAVPHWDKKCRELWVGEFMVKQFRVPAPNQETVLSVFEEEGWPARIDDPLSKQPGQDPQTRLRETIRSLNRRQKRRLLRFQGDGLGQGICWNWLAATSPRLPTDRP